MEIGRYIERKERIVSNFFNLNDEQEIIFSKKQYDNLKHSPKIKVYENIIGYTSKIIQDTKEAYLAIPTGLNA